MAQLPFSLPGQDHTLVVQAPQASTGNGIGEAGAEDAEDEEDEVRAFFMDSSKHLLIFLCPRMHGDMLFH